MTFRPLLFALALSAAPGVLVAQTAPVATAAAASPFAGRWTYSTEVPGQTISGFFTFAEAGGALTGTISRAEAPEQGGPLRDLAVNNGVATFWIDAGGEVGRVDFSLRLPGPDRLGGTMTAMGMAFDLAGGRVPAAPASAPTASAAPATAPAVIAGRWQYAMETPQGAMNGTIELTQNADGTYAGRVVRSGGEATALTYVTRDGNTATLAYANPRYGTLTMRLSFVGDTFTGTLLVGQTELPVTGTRLAP